MAKIDTTPYASPESPAFAAKQHAFAITKSDTDTYDLPVEVYVGVTGDVAIVPARCAPPYTTAVVFKAVPAGTLLPCKAVRVMSTGTTATDMVGVV